jgi:hypothetical protein
MAVSDMHAGNGCIAWGYTGTQSEEWQSGRTFAFKEVGYSYTVADNISTQG